MNKQEIARRLVESHEKLAALTGGLDEREFSLSTAGKWMAGQQLEHILRGVSAVLTGLGLPKFVPRLLFGKSGRASRDFETVVGDYRQRLAAGGRASGRFIPPPVRFDEGRALAEKLLGKIGELNRKLEKFSEEELDALRLPHPILGRLTIREMLYFTIYHADHHRRATLRNLGRDDE
ncbi:MAG: DinB family protein [Acidobacteria bacterium]|nr:DinB family protein [Acidobacteriota bacterium]